MTPKNPIQLRTTILHAAMEEILTHGLSALTLDRVAATASVSKGGLLHHFPTKRGLLIGLIDYLGELFTTRLTHALASEPLDRPGRWTRGYIRASFDTPLNEIKLLSILATTLPADPLLLEAYQRMWSAFDHPPDDQLPHTHRILLRLVCDGYGLAMLSGSPPIDEALRIQLVEALLELTQ